MPQYARPSLPESNPGSWTTEPLYEKIDEVSPSDADYVSSPVNPNNATFECALSPVSIPQTGGPVTLTVRLRRTADEPSNPGWTTIALLQGGQTIAAKLVQPNVSSFASEPLTPTPDEINSITNYHDLRLRVRAGVPVVTTDCCSDNPWPENMQITFGNDGTDDLSCLNGLTVPITWDGSFSWQSDANISCLGNANWRIVLSCVFGSFQVSISRWIAPPTLFEELVLTSVSDPVDCSKQTFTTILPATAFHNGSITATVMPAG